MIYFSWLSFLLLLFGFGWTIQNHFFGDPAEQAVRSEPAKQEKSRTGKTIVALGDSLTRGTGDADGKGYIGYLVDQLQEKSKEKITLHNLGVKGYRSEQLLSQVKESEIQRQIQQADAITITIGGNDLFQGGQTLVDLNNERISGLRQHYLLNLENIIAEVRAQNGEAMIFFVGLYNPFIDLNDAAMTTQAVRQWNFETSQLLDKHPQTVFVPTFDLFQLKVNDYLYSDKFHPNAEGYKLIAERVASLITW
ncbi:GDSL family lipase [Bacillus sp. T33-2]|nr:GDSL family lipase [Bacillus sp. T33-2]